MEQGATLENEGGNKTMTWKYTVNVGPTKGLIVEDDGTTVLELINAIRSSKFESTIQQIVRTHNAHDKLVRDNAAMLEALRELMAQLTGVGIAVEGQDEGQWHGTEGLSFSQARAAIAQAEGDS